MFTRAKKPSLALDLAPLIDVVFLLLIFFMLTSSFTPPSLPLDLPEAGGGQASPDQPVVVSVDAGGVIAINGEVVTVETFPSRLQELLKSTGASAVHFRGDRDSAFGTFVQLMDLAREAGAGQLHIVHQPSANTQPVQP